MFQPIRRIQLWYDHRYTDPFTVVCVKNATQASIKSTVLTATGGKSYVGWVPLLVHDEMEYATGMLDAQKKVKCWMNLFPYGNTRIYPGHLIKPKRDDEEY
jgi:hypothetical protein